MLTSHLQAGLNVVGRGSSHADHDNMLSKWTTDFPEASVHGKYGLQGMLSLALLSTALKIFSVMPQESS